MGKLDRIAKEEDKQAAYWLLFCYDKVRQIIADLEEAGFISNYERQKHLADINGFEGVVFR